MPAERSAPIGYDDALRSRLVANLAEHERRAHHLEGRKHAAVAVVLVDSEHHVATPGPDTGMEDLSGGAAFLLCRRAARLGSHARQWALPGGRLDPGESAVEAALRELQEELGIALGAEHVIGLLDDYPTRSGYVITPVVLWAGGSAEPVSSPDEVAHTYQIGLHELTRDDSPRFISIPESDRPVVQCGIGTHFVHAPTGAVLVQFRWVAMEGRHHERVDGFEQPVFAWR